MAFTREDRQVWIIVCIVGIVLSTIAALRSGDFSHDFNQFSVAAQLVGSGHLYSFEHMQRAQSAYQDEIIPFGRLPVYALLFKPLTCLPRAAARILWFVINAAALAGSLFLWPFRQPRYAFAAVCWSFPAAILLGHGQDTALFLLFATAGTRLLWSGQFFWAGLVYAMCANKFHLTAGLVALVLAARAWRTIWGGICGLGVLLAVSFAAEGPQWPLRLLELSYSPLFTPAPYKNPNLSGLAYWLPLSTGVEGVLAVAVLAATYRICRRETPEAGAAAALIAGLLTGHHAYVYDCILLIPALIVTLESAAPAPLRLWALLLCLPAMYQLLLTPAMSAMAQFSITGFSLVLLAVFVTAKMKRQDQAEPAAADLDA
jgi:hypothetical protein